MSCSVELPKSTSCTYVRQQWRIPSIKASQDPEKELMKECHCKKLKSISYSETKVEEKTEIASGGELWLHIKTEQRASS